jgi:hypothetical protein
VAGDAAAGLEEGVTEPLIRCEHCVPVLEYLRDHQPVENTFARVVSIPPGLVSREYGSCPCRCHDPHRHIMRRG